MQNIEEILKKPAFNALDPERKEMFKNLGEKIQGAGAVESLAIVADFMKKLPQDKQPTPQEQDAMLEAILEQMPTKESIRLRHVVNLMRGKR
ncbi:MAG: hypothetical protein LBS19_05805 [Clostridiales bacterium]|jgi:hypothetical protein|nr:hypothetical protein [Clostridiales bacterium]